MQTFLPDETQPKQNPVDITLTIAKQEEHSRPGSSNM